MNNLFNNELKIKLSDFNNLMQMGNRSCPFLRGGVTDCESHGTAVAFFFFCVENTARKAILCENLCVEVVCPLILRRPL